MLGLVQWHEWQAGIGAACVVLRTWHSLVGFPSQQRWTPHVPLLLAHHLTPAPPQPHPSPPGTARRCAACRQAAATRTRNCSREPGGEGVRSWLEAVGGRVLQGWDDTPGCFLQLMSMCQLR